MPENTTDELKSRLKKLEVIREAGINPYPNKYDKTHSLAQAKESKIGAKVRVAGRLMTIREMGKLCFCHLMDASGKMQIAFKEDEIGKEKFKFFLKNLDMGDFIGLEGIIFTTHKGEISVLVKNYQILAKTLRPLPEKWHGIQDEEECLRKRYLDIIFHPEVKEMIERKIIFWNAIREFLSSRSFIEVETPVLENTVGGAEARPFITHHNALDMDVYLRISAGELWQKRLMVAGFEKTFEIGRIFRNEGMDAEHLQDYTQMEFYWAYANYDDDMKLVEEMYKYVAKKTFGTLKFKIGDFNIDFGKKWEIFDYQGIIKKKTGIDILKTNLKEIEKKLKELKAEYDKKGFNITRGIDNLWKYSRKQISGPGFLINVPVVMEPLAKRKPNNPELVERFQVIIAGSEAGKGYSELNDPIDQAKRFAEQQKLREAGDEEAQMYDNDFVEALEYGMPPTCGFGMSERLFAFLIDKPVRETQIFPLMKPKK
jgi:lysyl-tRNA synthetase class 2